MNKNTTVCSSHTGPDVSALFRANLRWMQLQCKTVHVKHNAHANHMQQTRGVVHTKYKTYFYPCFCIFGFVFLSCLLLIHIAAFLPICVSCPCASPVFLIQMLLSWFVSSFSVLIKQRKQNIFFSNLGNITTPTKQYKMDTENTIGGIWASTSIFPEDQPVIFFSILLEEFETISLSFLGSKHILIFCTWMK